MVTYLLGIVFLMLIFVILVVVETYGKKPSGFKKFYKKERRAYPRYKIALRIKYKISLEEGVSWIRDISENGARLFLNKALKTLKVGESLGIEIDLPNNAQSVLIQGNIIWSKDDDAGVNFDKIIQGDVKKIIQNISDSQ